jgi:Ni,Fe-hydrogenase I cytochrome b subunit
MAAGTSEPTAVVKTGVPWYGKLILGLVGTGLIVKYTPVVEILTMFFYVVMIPFLLLASIGVLSQGAIEGVLGGFSRTMEALNTRVAEKVASKAA